MPLQERLAQKSFPSDARRLATLLGLAASGGGSPHALLGTRHVDTETDHPSEGALIVGNATPLWSALLHPAAAGYAMVTTATTWAADQTPAWAGLHTFNGGLLIGAGQTADLNGEADALVLDADTDTTISAPVDDQIDVEIGGLDALVLTADVDYTGIFSASDDWRIQYGGGSTEATSAYFNIYGTAFDQWADYEGDFEISANTAGGHGWVRFLSYDGVVTWTPTLTIKAAAEVNFNDDGLDMDFVVEAVGMVDALAVAGDTGRVTSGALIYGHVKSVTAAGELGNGPVENGEITGLGGTTYVAPSARLWAPATIL